jgi:hypothetical protein
LRLLFAFIGSVVLTGAGASAFAGALRFPNAKRWLPYLGTVLGVLGVLLLVLALYSAANYGT